jgi:hypothetical protein
VRNERRKRNKKERVKKCHKTVNFMKNTDTSVCREEGVKGYIPREFIFHMGCMYTSQVRMIPYYKNYRKILNIFLR